MPTPPIWEWRGENETGGTESHRRESSPPQPTAQEINVLHEVWWHWRKYRIELLAEPGVIVINDGA